MEEESDGWYRLRMVTTEWNSEEEEEEKKARGETNVKIKVSSGHVLLLWCFCCVIC